MTRLRWEQEGIDHWKAWSPTHRFYYVVQWLPALAPKTAKTLIGWRRIVGEPSAPPGKFNVRATWHPTITSAMRIPREDREP